MEEANSSKNDNPMDRARPLATLTIVRVEGINNPALILNIRGIENLQAGG